MPGLTTTRVLAFLVILLGFLSLLYTFDQTVYDGMSHQNLTEQYRLFTGRTNAPGTSEPLPPLYLDYFEAENLLPQHNENLPFPEGRTARFLRFGNQMWGVGLNNQFQEVYVISP